MPADPTDDGPPAPIEPHRPRYLMRAPPTPASFGLILLLSALLAYLTFGDHPSTFLTAWLLVFAAPAVLAGALTTGVAAAFGGRFEFHRGAFLALGVLTILVPIAALWRVALTYAPAQTPGVPLLAAFLVGPMLWFRHLSLYGVSRPSHLRSLPASILQPALYVIALPLVLPVGAGQPRAPQQVLPERRRQQGAPGHHHPYRLSGRRCSTDGGRSAPADQYRRLRGVARAGEKGARRGSGGRCRHQDQVGRPRLLLHRGAGVPGEGGQQSMAGGHRTDGGPVRDRPCHPLGSRVRRQILGRLPGRLLRGW